MNPAETPRHVGFRQASAGLGATLTMLSPARPVRPGLRMIERGYFGVGADEYGGKKLYDCAPDTFLFDFEPCQQEPGKCYRKVKPLPMALGAVGVLGLGFVLYRALKKR